MHINIVQHEYYVALHFESDKHYPSPLESVELDVIFTTPDHEEITVPAYWSGQNIWTVRYSSRVAGTHSFISACSDTDNEKLHQLNGEIEIKAYAGNNVLLKHGAPIVASDNRHFCHEDGTPFFWLGDTWWMGLCKRLTWPEDFKQLALDRQQKGFNVIQLVAGLYPDMDAFDPRGASESGFCWDEGFSQINPAFFDEADKRIEHLVSLGIAPCILGSWGYYLSTMGVEKMKQHWRYLMARWGVLPVVWAAAGEQTMPWYLSKQKDVDSTYLKESWSEVIIYMRQINAFNRIITTHPHKSARASVLDASLVDFEMQQTGHHAPTLLQAEKAQQGWEIRPPIPVISGESRYEALDILPKVTTKDARQAFWAHTINSGLAGHTYGANGIWQVNTIKQPFGESPNGHNWGTLSWQEAMTLPGANQLSLAKQIIDTMPWHQFEPIHTKKVINLQHKRRIVRRLYKLAKIMMPRQALVAIAQNKDQSIAICYSISLKKFKVALSKTINDATWFDPTDGKQYSVATESDLSHHLNTFKPPHKNAAGDDDWILILNMQ